MDGIAPSNAVNNTTERKMATKTKLKLHLKKGALHQDLGVKKGEKIPASKEAIKNTDSPLLKKRKIFAQNAKKWNK